MFPVIFEVFLALFYKMRQCILKGKEQRTDPRCCCGNKSKRLQPPRGLPGDNGGLDPLEGAVKYGRDVLRLRVFQMVR